MKLKHIGLINWANLPMRDYPFHSELVMITGHSAAGKTTLLDAIQTVMTAARHGVFQFNPGQEAATQFSRHKETRSVASYVLGCDDGSYARPEGAHCHLIAAFEPDNPHEKPFTALLSITAHLETSGKKRIAKENCMQMAVVHDFTLSVDDLCDKKGLVIAPENLSKHFKKKYPSLQYETSLGKDDYLCRLYGALKGQTLVNRIEAKMAARQLAKFMAYKPLGDNLDTFVRDEILEAEDLSEVVAQVSVIMKNIHNMEQEAKQIEHVVNRLSNANKQLLVLTNANIQEGLSLFENNYIQLQKTEKNIKSIESKKSENQSNKKEYKKTIESLSKQISTAEVQLKLLEKKADGIPELSDKIKLEHDVEQINKVISQHALLLVEENNKRKLSTAHIKKLAEDNDILFTDTSSILDAIIKTDTFDKKSLARAIQNDDDLGPYLDNAKELEYIYQSFFSFYKANKEKIDKDYFEAKQTIERLNKAEERLLSDVRKLSTIGKISYPKEVNQALKLIEQQYPLANARVLCDHVDVRLADWQLAIEGLLANNRFLLIVDEQYEADVIKLLKNNNLRRTGVIQGEKAKRDVRSIPNHSIVNLLTITDETAKAYLMASYGQVIQVNDERDLRMTPRGLMLSGSASSNYRMYHINIKEDDLVFGHSARDRARDAKKMAAEKLAKDKDEAVIRLKLSTLWRDAQDKVEPFYLVTNLENIIEQQYLKSQTQSSIKVLDLSEHETLLEEIENLKQSKLTYQEGKDEKISLLGRIDEKEKSTEKQLQFSIKEKLELAEKDQEYREFLISLSSYDEQVIIYISDIENTQKENGKSISKIIEPEKIQKAGQSLNQELWEINREPIRGKTLVFDELLSFAIDPQSTSSLLKGLGLQFQLKGQIDDLYQQFNNDLLVSKKESLATIADEFKAIFVNDLCHKLYNSIRIGKDKLDKLNQRLKNFVFGEEYYQFSSTFIAEFKDYVGFFEEIYQSGTAHNGLFEKTELSKKSQVVYQRIRDLLLADDFEKSKRELERLTDYRNYRSYDIIKHIDDKKISLKSYGTGSGAQLETPSYVIKAAALGAALKFDESDSALRMVLIDESFSKMDVVRCRQVLDYLSKELRLQVIFVVPNTKGGSLHDTINDLYDVCKVAEPSGRGELKTRVHVEYKRLKKEAVKALYQQSITQIQSQSEQLSFLDLVES